METAYNRLVGFLARHGIRLFGADWLEVRGRRSGLQRGVVVNPLELDGRLHLVAPRGETQWVKNLRRAGECTLRGTTRRAVELPVAERALVHSAYLERWGWQVSRWFTADSDPAAHPVFLLEEVGA